MSKKIVRTLQGELKGMSEDIAAELARLATDKVALRAKIVDLGLGDGTEGYDEITEKIVAIVNREAPTIKVKVGETKSIDAGYYQGGTIQTDETPGDYELTEGEATPTKALQVLTPPKKPDSEDNYYGFSQVKVNPIPEQYQDITDTTATAEDVLSGTQFVNADGELTQGAMVDNEAGETVLDVEHTSYDIPEGHHSGDGTVKIVTEEKTVTPSTEAQEISPTTGKVISKINVEKIPDKYGDVTDADAVAANILSGKKAVTNVEGIATLVTGTMPDNGAAEVTFNPLTQDVATIPAGYHNGSGTVALTEDLLNALRAL